MTMRQRHTSKTPVLQDLLDALDDDDCRRIIGCLQTNEDPMTARELQEECDIPSSTLYRKLDRLREGSLVEERTAIRSDGHHTSTYLLDFETVTVEVAQDGSLAVDVDRPDRSPDERLSDLWTEVRKET